jgi:PEGA domain
MKRVTLALLIGLLLSTAAYAKPKKKTYNNSPEQVFTAALRTARERHVVTYVDEKQLMFAFETGRSMMSQGFVANASVEPERDGNATLVVNVQNKKGMSWGAGDRMTDKFYEQVGQELSGDVSQSASVKPAEKNIAVPDAKGMPSEPAIAKPSSSPSADSKGGVMVISTPEGADVFVDDSFVGNAPANLRLPAGKHTLKVAQSGYKAWTRDLEVMVGSDVQLKALLEKE